MPTAPTTADAPMPTETRQEFLLRTGAATPRFLQGVFPFAGRGLFDVALLDDALSYVVPGGVTAAQVVYVRGGNHSDDLVYLVLAADGEARRYFPIGPKADFHVPLALVEPYAPGTRLEVRYAAPRGLSGTLIVDVGIIETQAAATPPISGGG